MLPPTRKCSVFDRLFWPLPGESVSEKTEVSTHPKIIKKGLLKYDQDRLRFFHQYYLQWFILHNLPRWLCVQYYFTRVYSIILQFMLQWSIDRKVIPLQK